MNKRLLFFMLIIFTLSSLHGTRIAIVSCYDPGYAPIGCWSDLNKKEYAEKHGYDFFPYTESLDTSRPPAWSKIVAVKKHLADYDWVFWTDADAIIMNDTCRLEEFIDENFDMILSRDRLSPTNTGHFFMRNCQWSFELLELIYAQTHFIFRGWWEQAALNHLIAVKPELRERMKFVDQRLFNAFNPGSRFGLQYHGGDFIIHFAGARGKPHLMKEAYDWTQDKTKPYSMTKPPRQALIPRPPRARRL